MTKTIEFVEKSIQKQTKKLEELKRTKEHYEILHKSSSIISYTPQIVSINLKIADIEFNLEHIKQIKCELEAWEVVKKTIKPTLKLDKEEYQPVYCWWIANEIINLDVLDYQTLKKALEVEDD